MGTVSVKWLTSKLMAGVDSRGQSVVIGTWAGASPPWMGLKPSDMLLLAAASCSAHDVVLILEKKRADLVGMDVTCTGDQLTEPPYRFTALHLHFQLTGNLDPSKVERAIQLSVEKYCSVLQTLEPVVEITYDYQIVSASPAQRVGDLPGRDGDGEAKS